METINLKGDGRTKIDRTKIEVSHAGGIITPVLPLVGPGNYRKVMSQISQAGLLRPTTGQTFSLAHLALQNPDEEPYKTILSILKNQYFWTSTENLWGKEDVIVYDNIDGNMRSNRTSLIKRMKNGDKAVRVVPYGFQTQSQSVSEFVKNPYIIAQVGDLPLEIVAEVAKKISFLQPYVYALGFQGNSPKRCTAVSSFWSDCGLFVVGLYDGSSTDGYASGICRSAEGSL